MGLLSVMYSMCYCTSVILLVLGFLKIRPYFTEIPVIPLAQVMLLVLPDVLFVYTAQDDHAVFFQSFYYFMKEKRLCITLNAINLAHIPASLTSSLTCGR